MGEEKLIADGCEKLVGLLAYFFGLDYFGSWFPETTEVVAKIEMEGSDVFVGFKCLIFIAVLATP